MSTMHSDRLREVEESVDRCFAENELKNLPFAQAVWTLFSVAEDRHFSFLVAKPISEVQISIQVDALMNVLSHPLRVLYRESPRVNVPVDKRYIDEHYGFAADWIAKSHDYLHFCSIFPLAHAGEIRLEIAENYIKPSDWSDTDHSFEVYDRLVEKRDPSEEIYSDPNKIASTLESCLSKSGGIYSIEFTRRLFSALKSNLEPELKRRHVLPESWEFSHFLLGQYRCVVVALQVMSKAWFLARQLVAPNVSAMAYQGSVWVPKKSELTTYLAKYTGLPRPIVQNILLYLTFGNMEIRYPDIAIQPLVDLGNDHFAISPFVLMHIHAERNLCVLINQIPEDRSRYSGLVDQKEAQLRTEIIEQLGTLGFDFKYGKIGSTDIDLAIIDRRNNSCLCIELKWFIEPAEIREVLMRSKELIKGVSQAKLIDAAFRSSDPQLMTLLDIDQSCDFLTMVGSVNFIGRPENQDVNVPILKCWHLIAKIKEERNLTKVFNWLKNKSYLPRKDVDYHVASVDVSCGKWKSQWYGFQPVASSNYLDKFESKNSP